MAIIKNYWWAAFALLAIAYSILGDTHRADTRNPPAYCVDPMTSLDLGQKVYGHCSAVWQDRLV